MGMLNRIVFAAPVCSNYAMGGEPVSVAERSKENHTCGGIPLTGPLPSPVSKPMFFARL